MRIPNFQRIRLLPATGYCELESTPLNIKFESVDNDSYGHICFHLENAPLVAALVKAINETLAAFAEKLVQEPLEPVDDGSCDPLYGQRIDSADMGEC